MASLSKSRIIIIGRRLNVERIIILMKNNKVFFLFIFLFKNLRKTKTNKQTYGSPFSIFAFVDKFSIFFTVVKEEKESP